MLIKAFSLNSKFEKFKEQWQPKIIGEFNDSHVKSLSFKASSYGITTTTKMNCST